MISRSNKENRLKPPESGGKPKKIGEDMGSPGGSQTPGEKGTYPVPGKKDEK